MNARIVDVLGKTLFAAVIRLASARFCLNGGIAHEGVQLRTVLRFGRRGEAIEGDLGEQICPVEKEADVRQQL